jgi:hypothetical protein
MAGVADRFTMQSNRLGRDLAILFTVVLLLYVAGFQGVEHLRARKGPWSVVFERDSQGVPSIVITQPKLGISRFQIRFPEESTTATNLPAVLSLSEPRQPPFEAPFGRVIYEDLTFLPGAVTLDLFGHEIEFLPRALIVNRREHPWQAEASLTLWRTNKVPSIRVPVAK